MDVQFDISNIYFGLQTLKELEESFVSLSSAMNGITINSSLLSSDSLFETSKREINNATNSTIHNLVTLLDNSKKILEQYDREAALLFQYYEQGILTEDGKWTAVPLMNQDDYGDITYSQGSVKTSGCGLTSLCMVASYILGNLFTPEDLAAIANADKTSNVGKMTTAADYVGLDWVKDPNTSREDLVNYLNEGKMVICLVKGSSHFVLCTGVNENGQIEVNDPYSPFRQESHKDGYDWSELQFSAGSTWVFDPAQNTGSNVVNDKVTVNQEVLDRLADQGIDLNAMNQVVPENTEVKSEPQPEPTPVVEEQANNQTTTLSAPEQQSEQTQSNNKKETDNGELTKEQLLEKTKEQARLRNQAIKEKMYHSDPKTTPSTYEKTSTSDTNVTETTNTNNTNTQPSTQEIQETSSTQPSASIQTGGTNNDIPQTPNVQTQPKPTMPETNSCVIDNQPVTPPTEAIIEPPIAETPDITPPTSNDIITEVPVDTQSNNNINVETSTTNDTIYSNSDIIQPERPTIEPPIVETPTIENNALVPKQEQPIVEQPTKEQTIITYSNNSIGNTSSSSSSSNINYSNSTTTKTENIDIPADITGTMNSTEEIITENDTMLDYAMSNDTQYTDYEINSSIGSSTSVDRADTQIYPTQMEDSVIPQIEEPQTPQSNASIKKENNNSALIPGTIGIATVAAAGIATVGAVKKSKKNNE